MLYPNSVTPACADAAAGSDAVDPVDVSDASYAYPDEPDPDDAYDRMVEEAFFGDLAGV